MTTLIHEETDTSSRVASSRPRRRLGRVTGGSLVLLLPLVILEVGVLFGPLVYIVYQSFFDWQPGGVSPFVGFDNYVFLLNDRSFWQVVGNQLFYLLGLPLWVVAPLLVAYMLRENVAGAGFFRSIYFLPTVMSPAIVGLVFRSLLASDGPFNSFLELVGLGALAQPWLTDADLVKPIIILLVLWAGFGTGVLIYSAALSAVPQELFEAARLDGVGFWGEFWHIAVPSIRPTILLWMMFQVISIFLFMFSWVYVLTGGGPGLASATMDFAVYQEFMRFGFFGTAAAQSVVLVLMIVITAAIGGVIAMLMARFSDLRAQKGGATRDR